MTTNWMGGREADSSAALAASVTCGHLSSDDLPGRHLHGKRQAGGKTAVLAVGLGQLLVDFQAGKRHRMSLCRLRIPVASLCKAATSGMAAA